MHDTESETEEATPGLHGHKGEVCRAAVMSGTCLHILLLHPHAHLQWHQPNAQSLEGVTDLHRLQKKQHPLSR